MSGRTPQDEGPHAGELPAPSLLTRAASYFSGQGKGLARQIAPIMADRAARVTILVWCIAILAAPALTAIGAILLEGMTQARPRPIVRPSVIGPAPEQAVAATVTRIAGLIGPDLRLSALARDERGTLRLTLASADPDRLREQLKAAFGENAVHDEAQAATADTGYLVTVRIDGQ